MSIYTTLAKERQRVALSHTSALSLITICRTNRLWLPLTSSYRNLASILINVLPSTNHLSERSNLEANASLPGSKMTFWYSMMRERVQIWRREPSCSRKSLFTSRKSIMIPTTISSKTSFLRKYWPTLKKATTDLMVMILRKMVNAHPLWTSWWATVRIAA